MMIAQESCRNLLLQAMREDDFALLAPHLDRRELKIDNVFVAAGQPIRKICFPEAGIVTFTDEVEGGVRIGVGSIGYDGFAGWPVLLGSDRSSHEEKVTSDGGTGLFISPAELLRACARSGTLRDLLLRFVQCFIAQLGRTVVSSLTQSVETRLCRWTIMAHDRVVGDDIKITHENVALMLAVRRASVTDALHVLEGEGLIRGHRGRVTVRDRAGLIRRAGDSYGFYEAEYSRLIARFPIKGAASSLGQAAEPERSARG